MNNCYVEKLLVYRDYPCVMVLRGLGHRCGYVGIPKAHKYYGWNYNNIPVECHGGLNYSESKIFNCEVGDAKDTWWIGFSCDHHLDKCDYAAARKRFADEEDTIRRIEVSERIDREVYGQDDEREIRTQEYVEAECCKIVDQLLADKHEKGAFHMELQEIIERLEEQAELLRSPQEKALMEAARMLKEGDKNVWIDAKECPPTPFSICIIRLAGNEFAESCMAMLTDDDWHYWPDRMGEKVEGKVTHWMPRPKAPK